MQVPDVEKFMADYNMQCPMAAKRLIYSGMPATVEHGKPRCPPLPSCHADFWCCAFLFRCRVGALFLCACCSVQSNSAVAVAETVQHFITAMDSLKLNMVAVDQVCCLISVLQEHMPLSHQRPRLIVFLCKIFILTGMCKCNSFQLTMSCTYLFCAA